ncbi:MAG: alpha/beta fold hydrolase [Syntrophobacteraceae bacterium]|jgi:dipeptidyl aminopeptidase/acylaminoacyl peptidase
MEAENCGKFFIDAGGISLSAAVHLPDKVPAPVIVCSHGLLSAKESPKFIAIGEQMSQAGFCVLRFDFSGCGESPPRPGVSLVEARTVDLEAAIGFALEQPWSDGRIGLLGSSFGGFLSLLAANHRPGLIRAAVSWAAPFDVSHIHPDTENFELLRSIFPGDFSLGSPKDLHDLGGAGRVLLIHGQLDEIVPWKDSVRIYERLNEPKRLLLMRTADHRVSDESWRALATGASLEWFLTHFK